MRTVTLRDDESITVIEIPADAEIRRDEHGADWISVQDPDLGQVWLCDHFLLAAAHDGDCGLRVISETPIEAGHEVPQSSGTMPV